MSPTKPIPATERTGCYLASYVCGCAVAFASARCRSRADENDLKRTLRGWLANGYKVVYSTERAELDEHMKTWGDCPHRSGQTINDVDDLLAKSEATS